jgi:2-keto-4-pentenoate hydratase/2-oxohepta-3-ene-1,7-dioic acid hydratase in catechol pathway
MSTELAAVSARPSDHRTPYQLAFVRRGAHAEIALVVAGLAYTLAERVPVAEEVPPALHELFSNWKHWSSLCETAAASAAASDFAFTPDAWLLPVQPSKLICIGTNYFDHLREMGTPVAPALPYSFLKPVSTGLVPTGASVSLPSKSSMVDWEAELALVIGHTPEPSDSSILDCVAGYTILNDLSARDWIIGKPEVGIDWVMMKAYDGFSPVGPMVTPAEFVDDPQDLDIKLWVNDVLKQDSNTSQMVFSVKQILEHLASIMTLLPGDVIATGTPAGVGFGQRPQQFLQHGDTVVVEIEGLGRLETHMVKQVKGAHT